MEFSVDLLWPTSKKHPISEPSFLSAPPAPLLLQMLQCDDGHWGGDYAGPMFLMPGLIIAFYVTGTPLGEARRAGMETYLRNHQQVGEHGSPTAIGSTRYFKS